MSLNNFYKTVPDYKRILKLDIKESDKYIIPLGIYSGCINTMYDDIEAPLYHTDALIWVREKETLFINFGKYESGEICHPMTLIHPGRIVAVHLKIYDLWKTGICDFNCNYDCSSCKKLNNMHFNEIYERISFKEFMRVINLIPNDFHLERYNFKPKNIWTVLEEEDI